MYDLLIIGAGPAGLTASIYASCFHLRHIVIGKELGGQLLLAPDILNYSGFEEISGKELTRRMVKQARKRARLTSSGHDWEIVEGEVVGISKVKNNDFFRIETKSGKEHRGRAVVLATGTERRKLNVPGEMEYTGKGVLYCATCERQDYKDKVCGVVGGANSAAQAAVQISAAAKKVYLIYRGEELRGDPVWLEKIKSNKKIEVLYGTVVKEIVGDGERLTGVKLKKKNHLTMKPFNHDNLSLDKLFIEIGGVPGSALLAPLGGKMDKGGYVHVNDMLQTSVPGIFAAGDLVHYGFSIEQIATAVGLGARAAASAYAYIKKTKAPDAWGSARIKRV